MKKKIIFEATIQEDDTVSISISTDSPKPLSLTEMLGCLEMLRQAAILSNKEFRTMYENIKWKQDDSKSSPGTSSSGGESA